MTRRCSEQGVERAAPRVDPEVDVAQRRPRERQQQRIGTLSQPPTNTSDGRREPERADFVECTSLDDGAVAP